MKSSDWVEAMCIAAVASRAVGERSRRAEGRKHWNAVDVAEAVSAWTFIVEFYGCTAD